MATRILVTGATGFIGSHVVKQLLDDGAEVVIITRRSAKLVNLEGLDSERLTTVTGDLTDPESFAPALEGVEQVYHIAGFISTHPKDRQRVYESNVTATSNLLAALQAREGVRVVYLASIFALGKGTRDRPATEATSYNLGSYPIDYFQAKRQAELDSYRYREQGLDIVHAYPCFCLGPGDVYISSSRLVVDFVQGKLPAYLAGGANFIDVRDAARGLILAMEKGKVGDKYLLGAHNVTFRQVLSLLAKITGRRAPKIAIPRWAAKIAGRAAELVSNKPPIDRASALLMGDHWYYDSSKAERELGLTARPLVETLRSAVAWFREHGYAG